MTAEGLILVVTIFAMLLFIYKWRRAPLSCFPEPKGWPVVGNTFQINFDNLQIFREWLRVFGGVYKLNLFGQHVLVVSSEDAVYEVLVRRGRDFAGRIVSERVKIARHDQVIPMLQPTKEWRDLRKCCHHALRMYDSGMERLQNIGHDVLKDVSQEIQDHSNKEFDLKPVLYRASMNFIMELVVGKKYNTKDKVFMLVQKLDELFVHLLKGTTDGLLLDWLPLARYLPFTQNIYKKVKQFGDVFCEVVEMIEIDAENRKNKSLLAVHALQDLGRSSPHISMETCRSTTGVLITAGVTTTTNVLYSLINTLLHNPTVYDKLRKELQTKQGTKKLTFEDKKNLPYLMATVYEILRYSSIAPFLVPHVTTVETTLQGKSVPAETTVLIDVMTLHHDPEVFPDPWEFRPERFLDEEGRLVPADNRCRKNLYAFGAGPRVCLGETLAKNRLFLLAGSLLQRYKFIKGSVVSSCDPRDFIPGAPLHQKPYTVFAVPSTCCEHSH